MSLSFCWENVVKVGAFVDYGYGVLGIFVER